MVRIIGFILTIGLIALGLSWLADRPGDVSVVWQGYRIETSVVVALAAVVAAALVLALAWALIRFIFGLPGAISFSSHARKRAKGFASVSRGLIAVGTGDSVSARRHASEADRLLGREPLSLLLRAQAAQMAGDRAEAETAFNLMLDTPDTRVLGLRGLFVEARRKGDMTAARSYAQKACELAPKVSWASEAVLEYQSADEDWRGALATLERQTRQKAIGRDTAKRLRAVLLTADALSRQDSEPEEALKEAREAVKLAPDLVPAAVLAGRLLSREGSMRKAAKILESAWKRNPHPDIAAAFVDLRPGDSARDRLERAESLARLLPHHPEARLMKAAAALEAQDIAKARAAIAPLLIEYPTVRTCLLMADIAEAEHGTTGEWREWIGRASRAPRDQAWIADGVISDTWAPVSPVTGRLDAFEWSAPLEQIADAGAIDNTEYDDAGEGHSARGEAPLAVSAPATFVINSEAAPASSPPSTSVIDVEPTPVSLKPATIEPAASPSSPAVEEKAESAAAGGVQSVVFPLDHAPDDPGLDGSDEFGHRPVHVQLAGRTP
ncbi:heme biosynthesis protein HemY [Pseudochelatococcus sp. G4_1912]|uniref:heme biosynthesis protein HemY n=1 Tax=Pseudochelatococcus sp. G4_1912 TaxID=3114288 RepID=UPI0039C71F44